MITPALLMFYTYILKSKKDNRLYIGSTNDLKRRFEEHNNGLSRATKYRKPFVLIYYDAYSRKEDSIKRERQLKRYDGSYYHLKKRLRASLEEVV